MSSSQHDFDQKNIHILAEAVSKAIQENKGDSRFIDISRIPLICLSIANISKTMDEMKEMMANNRRESDTQHEAFVTKNEFSPYKKALNIIGALAITGIAGALLSLVITK